MYVNEHRLIGFMVSSVLVLSAGCSDAKQQAEPSAPVAATRVYGGSLDKADCEFISGWAWDYTHPNDSVMVHIYGDDRLLGESRAALFRPDLAAAGKGKGEHGFKFPTPTAMKDGAKHVVRVRVAGDDVDLKRCPQEIKCEASDK